MIIYFCACIDKIGSFCLNFGINLVFCAFLCYTYSNYKEEMQNTFPFEIYFCGIWGRISVFGRVCIFPDKKQLSRTRRCNFGAGPPRRTSILPRGPISYLCGADSLRRAFFAALFFSSHILCRRTAPIYAACRSKFPNSPVYAVPHS